MPSSSARRAPAGGNRLTSELWIACQRGSDIINGTYDPLLIASSLKHGYYYTKPLAPVCVGWHQCWTGRNNDVTDAIRVVYRWHSFVGRDVPNFVLLNSPSPLINPKKSVISQKCQTSAVQRFRFFFGSQTTLPESCFTLIIIVEEPNSSNQITTGLSGWKSVGRNPFLALRRLWNISKTNNIQYQLNNSTFLRSSPFPSTILNKIVVAIMAETQPVWNFD